MGHGCPDLDRCEATRKCGIYITENNGSKRPSREQMLLVSFQRLPGLETMCSGADAEVDGGFRKSEIVEENIRH